MNMYSENTDGTAMVASTSEFGANPWHSRLSWKSILAGAATSIFTYLFFLFLGAGFGGVSLVDGFNNDGGTIGATTGVWLIVSVAMSLFAGTYIATRSTALVSRRIAMWQASVIAAFFFLVLIVQMGNVLGSAGRLLGQAAGFAGTTMASAASSPFASEIVEDSLAGLNLRAEPAVVIRGVVSRMAQGNPQAAQNYLARQSGVTPAEAQARIDAAKAQIQASYVEARETAGKALAAAGWGVCIAMLMGLMSAIGGAYLGARENLLDPVVENLHVEKRSKTVPVKA